MAGKKILIQSEDYFHYYIGDILKFVTNNRKNNGPVILNIFVIGKVFKEPFTGNFHPYSL